MISPRAALGAAATLALLASPSPAMQLINEIRIDAPGSSDNEYFELVGAPGASLDGLSYIVVGDSGSNGGIVEEVTDLTGQTIPADGFFLVAETSFSTAQFGGVVDLTASLNFENTDNVTHLLVRGFTGAEGNDLDQNDDGVFDVQPFAQIVDVIAVVGSGAGDPTYGPPTVGPDGTATPTHVFRFPDGAALLSSLNVGGFALGADDTPGLPNLGGSIAVATGGTQVLVLDGKAASAGSVYLILLSANGTSPGIPIGNGLTLPLVFDGLLQFSLAQANTAFLQNTFGALDASGRALASLTIPKVSTDLIGKQLNSAVIVLKPPLFGPQAVGGPVPINLD